jgi:hypothetical protein
MFTSRLLGFTRNELLETADHFSTVRELGESICKTSSIDWATKDAVPVKLRAIVKRLLRTHDHSPDNRKDAAELLSDYWIEVFG